MKTLYKNLIITAIIVVALSACQLFQKPTDVVVEGVIINKYTRQPIPGVAIVVRCFTYGSYGNTSYDSITAARSDAMGRYSLHFNTAARGSYRVRTDLYRRNLYDLTTYTGNYSALDGFEVEPGSSSTIDFQLVPLIPAKVKIDLSKKSLPLLAVWLQADESDGQGYFSPITIASDSLVANQRIVAQRLVYIVPNRSYTLTAYRAINHCQTIYQCQATNVSYEYFRRTVSYPDTAIITAP